MDEAVAINLIEQTHSIEDLASLWTGNIDSWKELFDYEQLVRLIRIKDAKKRTLGLANRKDEGSLTNSGAGKSSHLGLSSNPRSSQSVKKIPLIEMVPAGRRDEVREIIQGDPNQIKVLRSCKAGIIDCWTAMEIFGLSDPFNSYRPRAVH